MSGLTPFFLPDLIYDEPEAQKKVPPHLDLAVMTDLSQLSRTQIQERLAYAIMRYQRSENSAHLHQTAEIADYILVHAYRLNGNPVRRALSALAAIYYCACKHKIKLPKLSTSREQVVTQIRQELEKEWDEVPFTVNRETLLAGADDLEALLKEPPPD